MEPSETKTVETTTTAQPIVAPVVVKKSKKKLVIGLVILAIILIPLLTVGALAGTAAVNLGKDNSFSKLAAFLPTEQVPLLNSLGKSDSELLRDAFTYESNLDRIKLLGGREQKVETSATIEGMAEKTSLKGNMSMTLNSAIGKSGETGKFNFVLGGNIKSGIINVDLGQEGFKGDFLVPNIDDYFMKFNMSQELIDTLSPALDTYGVGGSDLKSYLDKYYKLNLKEYYEALGMAEMSPASPAEQQKAVKTLVSKLSPDVTPLYNKTLGDFNRRYATVSNKGRQTVSGISTVVLSLTVDGTKAGPVTSEFIDGITTILKNHKGDLVDYCKAYLGSSKTATAECTEEAMEEVIGSNMTASDKEEFEKSIADFFKSYDLSGWKFYINPVDNSIVKSEGAIVAKEEGLKAMESGDMDLSKFQINFVSTELSRGKDVTVEAPKDYTDLSKMIKEEMEKMKVPTSSPSTQMNLDELMKMEESIKY
jgi:hypothetical protein